MIIGVPREIKEEEYRVGIIPPGVRALVERGHSVIVERGAGQGCRTSDEEYEAAGAEIAEGPDEVYGRAALIMKVKEPLPEEYDLMRPGQILYGYVHLAPVPELAAVLMKRKITVIAYETIQLEDGSLPVLAPMSEVAGRMAVQVGAHFLEKPQGGRGVLLGGVPGVKRGRVTVIGAGTVGKAAIKIAVGMGAEVYVLDLDQGRLTYLDDIYGNRVTTMISNSRNLVDAVRNSHLVIGAVLIPGGRAPVVVTREMIRGMKAGSVVVDVAIDQGGCIETARPTSHKHPTYLEENVIHYCVTNMPGAVARTSTFVLTNATLPYCLKLADQGFAAAVSQDRPLARGVNLYNGFVTHENVAEALGYPYKPLFETVLQ